LVRCGYLDWQYRGIWIGAGERGLLPIRGKDRGIYLGDGSREAEPVRIFNTHIFNSKEAEPMVLDCSIDFVDSEILARSDKDHKVYINNNQALYVDLDEERLKTDRR